ncbi:MAG: PD40 domain-containing protein [Anaerolineales bacterium]|nr:PD40 domain-containing protein [Anaerolineales bacterium]
MTTDYGISHEQARAKLHTGRRHLNGGEAKQLDAHLAGCAACRAYANYVAQAEPALTAALRAQWDPAQPPQSARAFAEQVRARLIRPQRALPNWLSDAGVTLAVGAALLVLVVVWIGSGWGVSTGGPQPTEIVVESFPLPEVTAVPLSTPSPSPQSPALPAGLLSRWVTYLVRDSQNRDSVYVMRTDGRDGQRLTGLPETLGYDHNLVWSPDGARLALVSDRSGHPEVYVAEAGVWAARQLTVTPPGAIADYRVSWSPDGDWLAVTALSNAPDPSWFGGSIYLLDPNADQQPFPAGAAPLATRVTDPAQWSPDGHWLAYGAPDANGVPALFALEVSAVLTGANSQVDLPYRQLTKFPSLPEGSHDIYLGFAWSPDSRQVAYLRQGPWVGAVLSATLGAGFNASIEVISLDDPDALPTTLLDFDPSPNGIMGLSWSPDGAHLLYLSDAVTGGTTSTGCWTLRLVPSTGGAATQLDGFCALSRSTLPRWSSDGRYLLLATETDLAVIDLNAVLADPAQVQPGYLTNQPPGLAHSPAWQPRP